MENFEFNEEPKVKEKNIYLLHLDKARIAILSSIIIGIVAVSFLIGMKLTKTDRSEKDLFVTNNINSETLDSASDINDLFEPKQAENSSVAADNNTFSTDSKPAEIPVQKSETDVLTADNINIVPAVKNTSDTISVKPAIPKNTSKNTITPVSVNKKNTVKKTPVVNTAKNTVKPENKAVTSRINSGYTVPQPNRNGFAVQVASYDNMTRAKQECDTLKRLNFETYIDDAFVNGSSYYRVRIGPFSDRVKANSMLERLQIDNKYSESYIVKE